MEAPMETVIFLSPFFLDVNLTAFVIRLTSTAKSQRSSQCTATLVTLLHPVQIGNDVIDFLLVIGNIHCIMEFNLLRLELGLKDLERLRKLPFRPHD